MTFNLNLKFRNCFLLLLFMAAFAGCKVGEDDPALSFRSRNARLKANWKMASMNNLIEINSVNANGDPLRTEIRSAFDGYDLNVKTSVNGFLVSDSTFGYNHQMSLKDEGKLTYENTTILFGLGTKSAGADSWYWINTDEKKARVYLGSALQYAATAGVRSMQTDVSLPFSTLLTDFNIDGLKNKELKLSYHKTTGQSSLAGFQQITVTSSFVFDSK